MSCANHSIYINGRNVNLSQFSVYAKINDRWDHITDGRKLQAWLKEHEEDSTILSVLPLGTPARYAEEGWVTQTSTKYLLGKGKQIANGKTDPLFHDLTTTPAGDSTGLAVSILSARVKDGVFISDDKVSKNWRKAQADAMLQFFEERVARGDADRQAFQDTLRFVLGGQHGDRSVYDELKREFGTLAPGDFRHSIDHRQALAALHQMVKDDTLQPALQLVQSLETRYLHSAARDVMRSKRINLTRAAEVMKALREGEAPVSPFVAAAFLAHCSRAGGLGSLSQEELSSKEVREALGALAGISHQIPRLTVIDVVDVAGSICTNRRNAATVAGPETWVTMDGATTGFEGLRKIHEFDVSDVAQFLALEPLRTRHPNIDPAVLTPAERSALPDLEFDSPARIVRSARALKVAQAALSYNTTAYGGRVVLETADRLEELTGGLSIVESQRFLNDVLSKADPDQAAKQRRQLDDATNRARAVIHSMLMGSLPADRVDPDVVIDVGNYRKAVEEIADSVLLNGDPATFLRAISSTRTTIELMRFSVASGYVPRKGGNIEDTAADINRALVS
jgi:hypothetical protein